MSNINDYIKPSDYGAERKDINKILSLIHDFVAQEPEDLGNKERIMFTPHVKVRTTGVTVGSPSWVELEYRDKENFIWKKVINSAVKTYNLTHTTSGTLTFPVSDTKFGARCDFDGSSYITISDDTILDLATTISMVGFFYIPATDVGDTAEQTLIDKGVYGLYIDPHATAPNQIRGKVTINLGSPLLDETGSALLDEIGAPLTDEIDTDIEVVGTITPDAWNHIAVTFDGSNVKLYIDSTLTDTTAGSGTIIINTTDLTLG